MTRRFFLLFCLAMPTFAGREVLRYNTTRDDGGLIVVDGWILKRSDLVERST